MNESDGSKESSLSSQKKIRPSNKMESRRKLGSGAQKGDGEFSLRYIESLVALGHLDIDVCPNTHRHEDEVPKTGLLYRYVFGSLCHRGSNRGPQRNESSKFESTKTEGRQAIMSSPKTRRQLQESREGKSLIYRESTRRMETKNEASEVISETSLSSLQ